MDKTDLRQKKKIKKISTKKRNQNGFQFLLQSLDRGKQNSISNNYIDNCSHIAHSLFLVSSKNLKSKINQSKINQSKINESSKQYQNNIILQNVKMLDRSDDSIQITEQDRDKKMYKTLKSKYINELATQNKSDIYEKVIDLLEKTKKYISLTSQLINDSSKCKRISKQIMMQSNEIEKQLKKQKKLNSPNQQYSSHRQSFQKYKTIEFSKIINELQDEKLKLNNLISQHEMANIKMYIQLNQGQSQQIEMCKKQLSMLFQKYKKLQSLINGDRKKMIILARQKDQINKKYYQLSIQYSKITDQIQALQQIIREKDNQLNQNKFCKKNNKNAASQQQNQDQDSFLNSFCIVSSTNTARPKNLNKSKIGINLNALFEGSKDKKLQQYFQNPEKLKKIIKQWIQYQKIIQQQNKQLQFSINTIQKYIQQINLLKSSSKKQQIKIKQIQQEKKKINNILQLQKNKNIKHSKKQMEQEQKTNFKKQKTDQMYLVLTQALKIQQLINYDNY